jgi:hypothetical protein
MCRNLYSPGAQGAPASNKIAVCEKTQGLRSGNFSNLNSACSTVLVPVKIFQFQDMHYENRFLGTFRGHIKRPNRDHQVVSNFENVGCFYAMKECAECV